ncbi:DUF3953 domain-containing protein [Bacillus mesophilus]|uniref:DUF3953 domain-containing protein n=1 Tax=Bacillus mesophilus TaxID=1808955 RepID=A0A6M0Q3N0_9BACI|nr:DUF3953 domain-containing protein [Bacillus mesophilus]NEY70995.1 DUF3953 domain-containing protein [Bacillus mesophilus]
MVRRIFAVITLLFVVNGLFSQNFEYTPFMLLFFGLTLLVMGIEEYQKKRSMYAWLFGAVALLLGFASIQGFFFSY